MPKTDETTQTEGALQVIAKCSQIYTGAIAFDNAKTGMIKGSTIDRIKAAKLVSRTLK